MRKSFTDPYKLQRIALMPAAGSPAGGELEEALFGLATGEREALLELVIQQGLQFFWLDAVRKISGSPLASGYGARLKESCMEHTARYLLQKKTMIEVDALLEGAGIVYAIFKGAQVRESVYATPAYRPSIDIDILISPGDKKAVITILAGAGFTMYPDPANVSHEVSLIRDDMFLDLHWDIMRPGRMRCDVVPELLQSRTRQDFFWGLDKEAVLFVMLVHPVFTKYSTAPQSAIVRLVDLLRWHELIDIDWSRLLGLVRKTGMKTAVWVTLNVLENLTGKKFSEPFCRAVLPGQPRRGLLNFWITRNLSARFAGAPALSKYVFTLLAHDRVSDALGFICGAMREKRQRQMTLKALEEINAGFLGLRDV
jgi:hypothetical protein